MFRISSAGIAGDPSKLIFLEKDNYSLCELFNYESIISLFLAKLRLKMKFYLLTGEWVK